MLARSTRWVAVLLVAFAAVAWLALRDGSVERGGSAAADGPARGAALEHPARPPLVAADAQTVLVANEPAPTVRSAIPGPPELLLTLVDPRGAPVGGARWVAFQNARVLATAVTADDGAARVPLEELRGDEAGALELAVVCSGFHPLRATIAREPAEQRVVLGVGAVVSGIVRIDGAPPAEPLALELRAERPFWARDALPEPVALRLIGRPRSLSTLAATTGADGAFRFEGLPAGRECRLTWERYPLADPPPPDPATGRPENKLVQVTTPREGLVLELLQPFRLTGVVVDPVRGGPVSRATIEGSYQRSASGSAGLTISAGEDGAFDILFADGLPSHVELEVGDSNGGARRRHVVAIPAGLRSFDAGELPLAWTRSVAFRVRDAAGSPVSGALVSGVPGEDGWEPARADADGLGTVAVPPEATELRALALGFAPTRAKLPSAGAADERAELVLHSATTLELALPAGARELGVQILFGAEQPFERDGSPSWEPEVAQDRVSTWLREGAGGFLRVAGAKEGRYVFGGVRAGVALRVAAADRFGNASGEVLVPALAAGERRVVALALERAPRALSGRVVDRAGRPASFAAVSLGAISARSTHQTSTDDDGRFQVPGLVADHVAVVVRADGHPVKRYSAVAVGEAEVELVLDDGRAARIVVVDTGGEPVSGVDVEPAAEQDAWWSGVWTEGPPGEYSVLTAPPGEIAFTLRIGGRAIPGRIAAGADSARVEIPALRSCTVALAGELERLGTTAYVVFRPLGEQAGLAPWIRVDPDASEVRIERLCPGRYEACVQFPWPTGTERLCDPVEFEVAAGADARVELVLREP